MGGLVWLNGVMLDDFLQLFVAQVSPLRSILSFVAAEKATRLLSGLRGQYSRYKLLTCNKRAGAGGAKMDAVGGDFTDPHGLSQPSQVMA